MNKILLCCTLLLLSIGACKDHSVTVPTTSKSLLDSLRLAQPGSYWVYTRYALNDNAIPALKGYLDTLSYLEKDPTVIKDGITAMVLLDKYTYDGIKFKYDTLYWVVENDQLWERNHSFPITECNCQFQDAIRWRLLVDYSGGSRTLNDVLLPADSLPSLVQTTTGVDTVALAVTQIHVTNAFADLGVRSIYLLTKNDLPITVYYRTSWSTLQFSDAILRPADIRFAGTKTRSIQVSDSTMIQMATTNVGIEYQRKVYGYSDPEVKGVMNVGQSFERILYDHKIITH